MGMGAAEYSKSYNKPLSSAVLYRNNDEQLN